MLRRAAAIGRQGARPPAPAAAAASTLGRRRIHPTGGSTTMQRLLALTSSGGPRRSAFSSSSSSRPHGQQGQKQKQRAVSSLQDGDDEEGDEMEVERLESLYREQVALMVRACVRTRVSGVGWLSCLGPRSCRIDPRYDYRAHTCGCRRSAQPWGRRCWTRPGCTGAGASRRTYYPNRTATWMHRVGLKIDARPLTAIVYPRTSFTGRRRKGSSG